MLIEAVSPPALLVMTGASLALVTETAIVTWVSVRTGEPGRWRCTVSR